MTSSLVVASLSCILDTLLRLSESRCRTSGRRSFVIVVTAAADCVTEDMESIMDMYVRRSDLIFSSCVLSSSRDAVASMPMPEKSEVNDDISSMMVARKMPFI